MFFCIAADPRVSEIQTGKSASHLKHTILKIERRYMPIPTVHVCLIYIGSHR